MLSTVDMTHTLKINQTLRKDYAIKKYFSYFYTKAVVVGPLKNYFNERFLLSTPKKFKLIEKKICLSVFVYLDIWLMHDLFVVNS